MSQITITDLTFCETTGANTEQINGAYSFPSPPLSTSFSADFSASFGAYFSSYQYNGSGSIYVSYGAAAGGGAAAAFSDGSTSAYVYASSYAY